MVTVLLQAGAKLSVLATVVVPQVSEDVAVPVAAGLVSPVHSTVLLDGQVIVGGVVSTVVIVCVHVDLLPHWSVATQTRVIVPVLPQAGAKLSVLATVVVPQVSRAVAGPVGEGGGSRGPATRLKNG